ncbi:hypothetical protein Tco_0359105 [Tanacetum coccineum]
MDARRTVKNIPKFAWVALLQPKAWFKNRYSSAYRLFTRQGGVVFVGHEYGESVLWKFEKGAMGQTME